MKIIFNSIMTSTIALVFYAACHNAIDKELICGGDYKFWLHVREDGIAHFDYFDIAGHYELFFYENGIYRYSDKEQPFTDRVLSPKWYLRNDSIMYYSRMWKIEELTEDMMILSHGEERDTMFNVPKGMIPDKLDHRW